MLVSPFPRPQHVVRDPFVGFRRAAVCIFSLCLSYVAISSLDVFKQSDVGSVIASSKLGETLLLRPFAPIHAAGNELSALKKAKTISRSLDDSLPDSARAAEKGSKMQVPSCCTFPFQNVLRCYGTLKIVSLRRFSSFFTVNEKATTTGQVQRESLALARAEQAVKSVADQDEEVQRQARIISLLPPIFFPSITHTYRSMLYFTRPRQFLSNKLHHSS